MQYSESPGWRMLVKMLVHKDSLGIFHSSRIETARRKDGWTGLWLRPWWWLTFVLMSQMMHTGFCM